MTIRGSVEGLEDIKAKDADIKELLGSMGMEKNGYSSINLLLHVYRANGIPIYADYEFRRASKDLSVPRTIVVTK